MLEKEEVRGFPELLIDQEIILFFFFQYKVLEFYIIFRRSISDDGSWDRVHVEFLAMRNSVL